MRPSRASFLVGLLFLVIAPLALAAEPFTATPTEDPQFLGALVETVPEEEEVLAEPEYAPEEMAAVAEAPIEVAPRAAPPARVAAIEQALFDAANADRARNGLPMLQFAPELLDIARDRAQAQNNSSALNHYDSAGRLAFVGLFQQAGIKYRRAGENLARVGGSESSRVSRAEDAFMNSPTHRANILEGSYQYLAVGSGTDKGGDTTFAQIFWNP